MILNKKHKSNIKNGNLEKEDNISQEEALMELMKKISVKGPSASEKNAERKKSDGTTDDNDNGNKDGKGGKDGKDNIIETDMEFKCMINLNLKVQWNFCCFGHFNK
jgi:hypothetical protein